MTWNIFVIIILSIIYTAILLHFLITDVPKKAGRNGRRWFMLAWVAGYCFAELTQYFFNIPIH